MIKEVIAIILFISMVVIIVIDFTTDVFKTKRARVCEELCELIKANKEEIKKSTKKKK